MDRQLLDDLHSYFGAIQEKSEEETSFFNRLNDTVGYFPITYVHRDDLENQGYDPSDVDDATMEQLADHMKDGYLMDCYWIGLDCAADTLGIKKL